MPQEKRYFPLNTKLILYKALPGPQRVVVALVEACLYLRLEFGIWQVPPNLEELQACGGGGRGGGRQVVSRVAV